MRGKSKHVFASSQGRVTHCLECQRYGHIARICRGPTTCAECAGEHLTEACTKGPETSRKCASCKGNHRLGSQQCEFERKERDRAAYALAHVQSLYQCITTAFPPFAAAAPAPQTETQSQLAGNSWQPVVKARTGRPTPPSQAAKHPTQTRIPSTQIGKRKEEDFTSPTPPGRFARS